MLKKIINLGFNSLLFLCFCLTTACAQQDKLHYKVAFGSCSNQNKKQPILNEVCHRKPNLFIYLGDNIYGDTEDMVELQAKYDKLAAKPEFQHLKKSMPILATWDDHDYGTNDAGKYYPMKKESKEVFLNFWGEPMESERRNHEGIYHAVFLENSPIKIQVILLDNRTFRDNLTAKIEKGIYKNDYQPTESPDSTFLGEAQWAWLKIQLEQEADLRIIASSNQFSHDYNGWESWRNVPHEQKKMLQLIQETKANGIVFISGDVHWGELSKFENEFTYPIYDVTSSGLTQKWHNTETNNNRVGRVIRQNNFGLIEIEKGETTTVTFKILNKLNIPVVSHRIDLSELQF